MEEAQYRLRLAVSFHSQYRFARMKCDDAAQSETDKQIGEPGV
jgi:hypothetical protein